MNFQQIVKCVCGTAVGVLAIHHRRSNWTTPVHAEDCQKPPNIELEENPQECPPVSTVGGWDCNWDRRHKLKGGEARHIIFICRGQRVREGEYIKRNLSDLGREQAKLVGKRLQELGHPWTRIIHSNYAGAREFAEIIASYIPNVPRTENELLHEETVVTAEPAIYAEWFSNPKNQELYGPSSEASFRQLFYRPTSDQTSESFEIVVCSPYAIRYLICRIMHFVSSFHLNARKTTLLEVGLLDGNSVQVVLKNRKQSVPLSSQDFLTMAAHIIIVQSAKLDDVAQTFPALSASAHLSGFIAKNRRKTVRIANDGATIDISLNEFVRIGDQLDNIRQTIATLERFKCQLLPPTNDFELPLDTMTFNSLLRQLYDQN